MYTVFLLQELEPISLSLSLSLSLSHTLPPPVNGLSLPHLSSNPGSQEGPSQWWPLSLGARTVFVKETTSYYIVGNGGLQGFKKKINVCIKVSKMSVMYSVYYISILSQYTRSILYVLSILLSAVILIVMPSVVITIAHSQYTIGHSQYTIGHSQYTIGHSQYTIAHTQYTITHSQYTLPIHLMFC